MCILVCDVSNIVPPPMDPTRSAHSLSQLLSFASSPQISVACEILKSGDTKREIVLRRLCQFGFSVRSATFSLWSSPQV